MRASSECHCKGPWLTHTPPGLSTCRIVSTYSTTLVAVSMKKQVATRSKCAPKALVRYRLVKSPWRKEMRRRTWGLSAGKLSGTLARPKRDAPCGQFASCKCTFGATSRQPLQTVPSGAPSRCLGLRLKTPCATASIPKLTSFPWTSRLGNRDAISQESRPAPQPGTSTAPDSLELSLDRSASRMGPYSCSRLRAPSEVQSRTKWASTCAGSSYVTGSTATEAPIPAPVSLLLDGWSPASWETPGCIRMKSRPSLAGVVGPCLSRSTPTGGDPPVRFEAGSLRCAIALTV
mmetsp:Transcript_27860/g.62166  ORF Transcript_27860/g.62166 Transcript_27860/m.62166 type:complete len:290 (-) Transcript_27860:449-1318(-)